jgi:hypothetical protein
MEETSARGALLAALTGMLSSGPAAVSVIDPDTLDESEELPATTIIYLGDFSDGRTAAEVDQSSIMVNEDLTPQSASLLPSHPDFTGEVVEVIVSTEAFMDTYGTLVDTVDKVYMVSWKYNGEPEVHTVYGPVTLICPDFIPGDANGDMTVNVGDALYIVNYVFKSGPAPEPLEAADANCDVTVDVGDAVYLINYIFRGGPPPGCD